MFDKQKQQQLSRPDFSKKGSVDKPIANLVKKINSSDNYYTTSSCSGRIMVLSEGKKKNEAEWLFVSHEKTNKLNLNKIPKEKVWIKFEPMILHVACRTLDDAQRAVDKAKAAGFKWSGIMSVKNRFLAEIKGTDFISTVIADKGKLIVDKKYLKLILNEANKKMKRNLDKIKKFEKSL